ncbi:MAG: glycerophosphodiester phosphodiesterase, partial [Planctomycetes bacterium]|nr:glycerophosphodiester phosphodiesterase [Planctomycetota bacterium]
MNGLLLLFYALSLLSILSWAAPLIVAHRGASKSAPENTLPAFKLAWEQGAHAIEGDFRITLDEEIVCHHDKDTKRTTGKEVVVARAGLEELKALDAGSWKGSQWAGTPIPMLKEVAATVPEKGLLFIEIKCGLKILPKLIETMGHTRLGDEQIVVIAFDAKVLQKLK